MADQIAKLQNSRKGLIRISFIRDCDYANAEIGTVSVWESKEASDAAQAKLGPLVRAIVDASGTHLDKPPIRREFEVYGPRV